MSTAPARVCSPSQGYRRRTIGARRGCGARKLGPAIGLIAPPHPCTLPSLQGIALRQQAFTADWKLATLAKNLFALDLLTSEDWIAADGNLALFVKRGLQRTIEQNGGHFINEQFDLRASITDGLLRYEPSSKSRAQEAEVYLTIDPESCGYVVLGPTLRLLEGIDPQLGSSFFCLFIGAIGRWMHVYDYRDAQNRVEVLREWIEGEENRDQYDIPDVEKTIPPCIRQFSLKQEQFAELASNVKDAEAMALLHNLLDLNQLSNSTERPGLSEEVREVLSHQSYPLPGLVAVFEPNDAIEGCFQEEAETMLEYDAEPNLVLPFRVDDKASIVAAFGIFNAVCRTLAAAARLIGAMPGNRKCEAEGPR